MLCCFESQDAFFSLSFICYFRPVPPCLEALAIKGHPDNLAFGRVEVVDSANLTKRQDPITPEECFLSGLGMSSYWYMPVYSGDEVCACVMGHKRATGQNWECPGDEFWPDSYLEEIIAVGKEQITKDGGGEKSYNGVFQARWEGTTSAVSDQEGMSTLFDAIFRYTMPDCDANPGICTTKSRHYYYKYKGDAIGIIHKKSDCRGFLGVGGDTYAYCPGRSHCQD